MRIKKFTGSDMKATMRSVRELWGPDAVILASKRLENSVEITAAIDFEEEIEEQIARAETVDMKARPNPADQGQAATAAVAAALNTANGKPHSSASINNMLTGNLAGNILTNNVPTNNVPTNTTPGNDSPGNDSPGNDSLVSNAPTHNVAVNNSPATDANGKAKESANDTALAEMRRELTTLRGLLEGELSQLAWRETARQHPLRTKLIRKLAGLGLDREFCTRLAAGVAIGETATGGWKKALVKISQMLKEPDQNILESGGVIAIVGSTGVGKTTSVAKLAARYALRHGRDRVGLVTTDCFRIGGQEQLDTFGKLLDIPVLLASNRNDLAIALDKLADKKLVLIDTAGMSQRDLGLSQQFATLKGAGHNIKVYLTLSATAQKTITDEIVRVFSEIELAGTIITKIDEAASLGAMLTTLIRYQLPTMFISNGQQIPEDIHVSKPIELVKIARDLMEQMGWQQPPPPSLIANQDTQAHA